MKLEDFGYCLKTGRHDRRLTRAEGCFVGIIWVEHMGADNKISAPDFAVQFAYGMTGVDISEDGREVEAWKRDIRHMHTHLLQHHDDIPVISKSGNDGGYWIAATEEEATVYYYSSRKRGLTGLIKATRAKKGLLIGAVEQLAFNFPDLVERTALPEIKELRSDKEMAPDLVDALLGKMTSNPEQFADGLRKIREKYFSGGVLLGRDRLAAMRAKTDELSEMVAGLEG